MRRVFLVIALLSVPALADSLFDPASNNAEQISAGVNSNAAATTQGVSAGFVVNGSQATMVETLGKAIAAIQKRADQAASEGKTDLHDSFVNSIPTYQALLEKARTQGLHPSLYPFTLGKKGCLFAFRQGKFAVGPAVESLMVPVQTVSWMRIAITAQRDDGSLDAEVRDNANRILLYRACLHGISSDRLKPGVTAQLQNMPFEITQEESTDQGTTYHLKRIPPVVSTPR